MRLGYRLSQKLGIGDALWGDHGLRDINPMRLSPEPPSRKPAILGSAPSPGSWGVEKQT